MSLIFNVVNVAPMLVWPFFLPYLAEYFLDTTQDQTQAYAESMFVI